MDFIREGSTDGQMTGFIDGLWIPGGTWFFRS